jgi:hypothetical protein
VPAGSMWSCWIFERTQLMLLRQSAELRGYVILSNSWKNSANVTMAMCPQPVCDPVEYWRNSANAMAAICPQDVRDAVKYLKDLSLCHDGDVPSAGTWSCRIFERIWLISRWRCALRLYVILSDIWKNSANVTVVVCPQRVCDPVEYLKEPD